MHWRWRAVFAIGLSCICGAPFVYFIDDVFPVALRLTAKFGQRPTLFAMGVLLPMLGVLAIYGLLTKYVGPETAISDGETRCRKCQHILRGLSEPRCPECGERI